MALLAKKSGMVRTCPIPMKRSRVFIRHAISNEKVENKADPRTTKSSTKVMAPNDKLSGTPIRKATR
ncbi:hypothetical protein D3C78_1684240 [compost metagenome]